MKLSVIVPVYNLGAYVGDCLQGLVTQEVDFRWELIVGDDGSTDGSRAIAEGFAERHPDLVRVLPAEPNMGLARNLKRLMAAVRGQYVAHLDGDDLALPGKLAVQVAYLDANPGCALVYHESEVFDSDTGARIRDYSKGFYNWRHIPPRAGLEDVIRYGTAGFAQASSIMFRAHDRLVESVDERFAIICDVPMIARNMGFLGGTADFIDRTLGRYRIHGSSFGAATAKSNERRLRVMQELLTLCESSAQFGLSQDAVRAGVGHVLYASALNFLKRREDALFAELIERSVEGGFRFDERHALAHRLKGDPDEARRALFGEGA
jgi:glycosyltransferase involved in cell wall biosynthesis